MITIIGRPTPLTCDVCGKLATGYVHWTYPTVIERAGCDDHPVANLKVA